MSNDFITKKMYLTDKRIITSSSIYEYDIKQANINILYGAGMIDENRYNFLKNTDKQTREIIIGKSMIIYAKDTKERPADSPEEIKRKRSIISTISSGIANSKIALQESNGFPDTSVVRIANDAVYVESSGPLRNTIFDIYNNGKPIEFKCKNHFTSFIQFSNRICIFFRITNDDEYNMDVKGIGESKINMGYHNAILSFIGDILFYLERTDRKFTLRYFNEFYERYIRRELPIEYYREFTSTSSFRLIQPQYHIGNILSPTFEDPDITVDMVDIGYNAGVLRDIYSILCSL